MKALMDFRNNYAAFRKVVKNLVPPLIPCQEIVLKDLLYTEESLPNLEDGKVNLTKMASMGDWIKFFRNCQTKSHYRLKHYSGT